MIDNTKYKKTFYIRDNKRIVGCRIARYTINFSQGNCFLGGHKIISIQKACDLERVVDLRSDYDEHPYLYLTIDDAIEGNPKEGILVFEDIKFNDILSYLYYKPEFYNTGPAHCRGKELKAWTWDGYKPILSKIDCIRFDVMNECIIKTEPEKKYYTTKADCLVENQVEIIDFDD